MEMDIITETILQQLDRRFQYSVEAVSIAQKDGGDKELYWLGYFDALNILKGDINYIISKFEVK